jgi:tetratricopeptide (TPR) repeat protein
MTNHAELDPQTANAIAAALENNWPQAIQINQTLLRKYPNDIDTMNRLARAFTETSKLQQAKKLYEKILKLDPYNQIAEKNLSRLSSLKKSDLRVAQPSPPIKADIFLEEPGKTATLALIDTAMSSVLAGLRAGDAVVLSPHRNDVTVISTSGQRIGKVENYLAKALAGNLRDGSVFDAFIKSVSLNGNNKKGKSQVTIFVRETHRSPKIKIPPFLTNTTTFTPYAREETLGLLSQQAPVPTEGDDGIEEVEVSELPSVRTEQDQSLEELAEKEAEESDHLDEE